MFPYQRKKRKNSSAVGKNSNVKNQVKNTVSRVKRFYFDAYDRIVKLVAKQNYTTPQGYNQFQWRQIMINLQCTAYLNLKRLVNMEVLDATQLSHTELSSLNGYSTPNSMHNWHEIYLKQIDG